MTGPTAYRWLRWPANMPGAGLAFGADYNPEQWPREVWDEDLRAMREAGPRDGVECVCVIKVSCEPMPGNRAPALTS